VNYKAGKLPRAWLRVPALLVIYTCTLGACLWLSYLLRFDFEPAPEYLRHFAFIVMWLVGAKLVLLAAGSQFDSLLTYFGFNDVLKITGVTLTVALSALVVWLHSGVQYAPPRAVILTDFVLSTVALCSTRMAFRLIRQGYFGNGGDHSGIRRIGIVGAGDVGAGLVRDMQLRRGLGRKPIVFFDDDPSKLKSNIHGVPVVGRPEKLLENSHTFELNEVIIAMPSAPAKRIREVVKILNTVNLRFAIVPSYEQLLTGKVQTSHIRSVEI
jgi:FlaA1/EpsC-like NDP-sugar epimerase